MSFHGPEGNIYGKIVGKRRPWCKLAIPSFSHRIFLSPYSDFFIVTTSAFCLPMVSN